MFITKNSPKVEGDKFIQKRLQKMREWVPKEYHILFTNYTYSNSVDILIFNPWNECADNPIGPAWICYKPHKQILFDWFLDDQEIKQDSGFPTSLWISKLIWDSKKDWAEDCQILLKYLFKHRRVLLENTDYCPESDGWNILELGEWDGHRKT
jgi:hypothetical protein